ncbi:MAG TPA: hypothetical protein DD490_25185 [Acidobacteria bacterium]|nr:hypothetical protein [Acidobacteriota bacterium]
MNARPVLAALAALTLLGTLSVSAQDEAQPIRFAKGKSSAEIHGTITPREDAPPTAAYLLRAAAGQTMTIRFASPDPGTTYSVACPGPGSTDAGASPWSFELPEAGDYRITVSGPYDAAKPIPFTLHVAVEGKPHPVAPKGLTGTYGRLADPDSTIEIEQLPAGRLRFYLLALWKGARWEEYGPNLGEASGEVELTKNRAVYKADTCVLTMSFADDRVTLDEQGECGFGHNVTAAGTYKRVSLCAAPGAQGEGR